MNSKEEVQLKVFDLSIINYQIIDVTNKDKVRAVEKKKNKGFKKTSSINAKKRFFNFASIKLEEYDNILLEFFMNYQIETNLS